MELLVAALGLIVILYYARRLDQIKAVLEQIRDDARAAQSARTPANEKPEAGLERRAVTEQAAGATRGAHVANYGQMPTRATR